ncbi:SPOR domain-containing protein [sulfur-oxidizing endosymbiont of Gigantopelta aegis]|uniref:SPOR domain-containing protein n=1 Tax=sulfur-oxidizing endosymbiont of Gigantopelta aegis TaxID=2794934 RepID=UPI0018DC081F|nr:SPOR domain-containing protein [sulfur-oxidizing endosymbiont of Gigantopelta aegis]
MPVKKKRARKKMGATRNTKQGVSKFSIFVITLLLGAFVGFLIYLDKIPTDGEQQATSNQQSSAKATDKPDNVKPKHLFDFYTVLPDREVDVLDYETTPAKVSSAERIKTAPTKKPTIKNTPKQKTVAKKQEPIAPKGLYQLQVGAFKELSKADAMKARLAFLGVVSNIQVIQNNGQTLYRVRIGPSTDQQKMQQIKAQLKAQNINTFVQKLSG